MVPMAHRRDDLSGRLTTVKIVVSVANSVVTAVASVLIAAISPVRIIIVRADMPTAKEAITARAVSVRIMEGIVVKADMVTVKEVITVRAASVRTTVVTVAKAVTVTVKEAIATIMVERRTGNYDPNAKYSMKKQIEYKELNVDPDAPIRLNKFLANAGVCSRREADEFITAGVVSVNGTVVTELGTKVKRTDEVKFHEQPVSIERKVYVLLNKPKDYVTTSDDPQNRKTVMDLVKNVCRERIYPVGRLDRNTTGVLLFTNDGELASKLTHPKFLKKKIYHVTTDKNVTAADMRQIAEGITLEDGEIRADAIDYASPTDKKQVGIEIHSGKNRIVRRIFEALGYRVVKLDRVLFAGLTKKNVRRGDWRFLTEQEVNMLRMGAFE